MRTLRFHEHGPALDVLQLDEIESPEPGPGQIRVRVEACGLNPADWALCEGLLSDELPRGIGIEVSGTVDAVGPGVHGVALGDPVLGPALFRGPSAGAAEQALLDRWVPRPAALGAVDAAALPIVTETACYGVEMLGVREGTTVLVQNKRGARISARIVAQVNAMGGKHTYGIEFVEDTDKSQTFWGITFPANA